MKDKQRMLELIDALMLEKAEGIVFIAVRQKLEPNKMLVETRKYISKGINEWDILKLCNLATNSLLEGNLK